MTLEQQILSEVTIHLKYAKYLPSKERRETWEELVTRNKEMHLKKFPDLHDRIEEAYNYVYNKKILPSMRSMQFAGKPIEINNARIFNCSYLPIDDYRSFSETMFLLLSGCGVGYSVQTHHVDKLPEIRKPLKKKRYLVGDSIEGWADAVRMLTKAYFGHTSTVPDFDFRDIRPKGAHLITVGGKAPGPEPLKIALVKVQSILDSKNDGDKLTSLECHDIICHLADAVLSGGIRRAALISLFNLDDEEMLSCKFGAWWELNPQRGRANNSAVLMRSKITRKTFLELWKKIELSNSGEPGFIFTNDKDMGTNPCITSDTWVTTNDGPKQVKDLIGIQTKLLKDGEFFDTTNLGFVKTGNKEVFKLKLKNGLEIKATDNHQFLKADDSWVELKNLKVGDNLKLSKNNGSLEWEGIGGSKEEGWLIGNLIGDGTFSGEMPMWKYWGDDMIEMRSVTKKYLDLLVRKPLNKGREYNSRFSIHPTHNNVGISSARFKEFTDKWDIKPGSKHFNTLIERSSSNFYKGVIGGFFDADGSIWGNNTTGLNISISQNHKETLQIIQRMLYRFGIESNLYKVCDSGYQMMPDGKGGSKKYPVQEGWELRVSGRMDVESFFKNIHVNSIAKINKFNSTIIKYSKKPYQRSDSYINSIISIEKLGVEEVFDCTVPKTSCFDANGIITHNCAEISLKPNQFCNLCEINVSDLESQEELDARAAAASFIGTLQASYTDFHYLRDIWKKTTEKEALLGIGMTGIASGKVLELDMEQAAKIACDVNQEISKIIGINKASRVTTVKPSGTTSLVLGTSSGIHAWHDDFYLRRIRLGKNEALYTHLSIHHPELLEDDYFKPHLQSIVTIPQQAPKGSITRQESALSLLERVKQINKEWIQPGHRKGVNMHNVSATISVKPDEWVTVGDWVWDNKEFFTALSFLPMDNGSYVQAPFQSITEKEFNEKVKHLHAIDLSKVVEVSDNTTLSDQAACQGNLCEII